MSAPRLLASGVVLALGYAITGGLYWTLLNVPESSVVMLAVSLLLVIAGVACAGVAIGAAIAVAQGASAREASVSGVRALPLFVLGLLLLGILIWLTAGAENWWEAHSGEVDALALRYLKTNRTSVVHIAVYWLLWLVRWGLGLSLLGGLSAAGALRARARKGLRSGLSWLPLLAVIAAVLVYNLLVWRFAYWRPEQLATSREMAFVSLKFALMYVILIVLTAAALAVHGRRVRTLAEPAP